MPFVFSPPPPPSLPIHGTKQRFPVRRIFCVGRNYAEHVVEMGGDPERGEPFFFMKPATALWPVPDQGETPVPFPPRTEDLHHEIELVAAIGLTGADIAAENALEHVYGYGVGVDLTRRDLQAAAKKDGRPWDMAKGFDHSAPMGCLFNVAESGHPASGRIHLGVNGSVRQDGDLAQQIWTVPEIISTLSTYVTIEPGDLIMTGTPAGVGRLQPGDEVTGAIDGLGDIAFTMGERPVSV